ncbi:patatin-like protein [Parvibaculum sp.]|uniref:patatin-like protein n=1 Tax=Parvibaculum sp. TaxID=2024848 RepID=UPI002B6A5FF3|nr:patatin-like protein [Parvibaculum sp.]HUD52053.1 patatin-like protein [Parvibaculum sp.]
MKEKELRLALVCYGGVSLAVYMYGVSREILKLVRASRVYHGEPNHVRRQTANFSDLDASNGRECDTEELYFELLRAIGGTLDLRVFVDTIAGASAGGINGVLLARALAHDLPLDRHRRMWLEQADILALMDEEHIAGKWSKLFMKPVFWAINNRWLSQFAPDAEMRQKLLLFTRSRWFKPPFSGELMTNMLLDACRAMEEGAHPGGSLLPVGHRLELIVSVTDFYGFAENIPLHDPPSIREREHRHMLKFGYMQHPGGRTETDFDRDHVPGLVFAARATSSFPGAFPAAQIGEIDEVLETRGETWPTRAEFLAGNFKPIVASGADPVKSSFIDGSVLNNKPFGAAIASLRGRPAYREVDRRIVYIDPDPEGGHLEGGGMAPGFFHTIRGALSDIPRNQPVRDELESVHEFSERIRQYRQIVAATRPHVAARIRELLEGAPNIAPTPHALADWRNKANAQAAVEAGYAYDGYIQLKVSSVLDGLARFIGEASGKTLQPSDRLALSRAVEDWARDRGIFPVLWTKVDGRVEAPTAATSWVRFLRDFDLSFRIRRLRFVIRRLNELYEEQGGDVNYTNALDEFKASLYECLELLNSRPRDRMRTPAVASMCAEIFANGMPDCGDIDRLIEHIGPTLDLVGADHIIDQTISVMSASYLPHAARLELIHAFVGFPFFDVLTLPLNKWNDLDDVDTVQVDRISPEDAKAIRSGGAQATLMGRDLGHFAAFFSRRARENDYLWGRLHAADRLVDIVTSTAGPNIAASGIDLTKLKGRLFRAILLAEKPHLAAVPDLIRDLGREIGTRFNIDMEDILDGAAPETPAATPPEEEPEGEAALASTGG